MDKRTELVSLYRAAWQRVEAERDAARAQIAEALAACDKAMSANVTDADAGDIAMAAMAAVVKRILSGSSQGATEPSEQVVWPLDRPWGSENAEPTEPSDILVQDVHATEQKRYTEPSAYARFAKIASQFPADIAKEIGLWMRSAGYDPTEEGEHERWAKDYNMPHEFRPVAGHPDDDECTDRRDGTDATYCGLPRRLHGYPRGYYRPRSRAVYGAETKGEKP